MLEDASDILEIFCELHEDILVRKKDSSFIGIQVKTREPARGPFRARDPEIISAFSRFALLERNFPGRFARYVVATNAGFWADRINGSNLAHLLACVGQAEGADVDLPKLVADYVGTIALKARVPDECVLGVFSRTELTDNLPALEDIEQRLVRTLSGISTLRGCRYDELDRIARGLTDLTFRAASLAHDDPVRFYLAIVDQPEQASTVSAIDAKRVTKDRVLDVVEHERTAVGALRTWNRVALAELPRGMHRMELKMAAGGLSAADIDLSKDCKFSTEVLLDGWLYKYGPEIAGVRYEHLRTVARTECQEACDMAREEQSLFGAVMLAEIRRRLRDRHDRDRANFFDCEYEHLLGMAGVLTEDCTVWWTDPFDLPKEPGK